MYYQDKLETLQSIFGTTDISLKPDSLKVGDTRYPILDDVIVLTPPEQWPEPVARNLSDRARPSSTIVRRNYCL